MVKCYGEKKCSYSGIVGERDMGNKVFIYVTVVVGDREPVIYI